MFRACCFFLLFPFFLFSYHGTLQLRAGYFLPASPLFRDIYHNDCGVEGEVETSVHLYKKLDLFANANLFKRSGHSIGLRSPTAIAIYPLSLGLKCHIHLTHSLYLYFGAAPTFTWLRIHDHSPYVKQFIHKQAWGGVWKAGFIISGKHLFLDLFTDYYYTKISRAHFPGVESHARNIGGLRTGFGVGIKY